jgi:hypothetical protein
MLSPDPGPGLVVTDCFSVAGSAIDGVDYVQVKFTYEDKTAEPVGGNPVAVTDRFWSCYIYLDLSPGDPAVTGTLSAHRTNGTGGDNTMVTVSPGIQGPCPPDRHLEAVSHSGSSVNFNPVKYAKWDPSIFEQCEIIQGRYYPRPDGFVTYVESFDSRPWKERTPRFMFLGKGLYLAKLIFIGGFNHPPAVYLRSKQITGH